LSAIRFLAEAAATGLVMGARLGSLPEQVEAGLGGGYLDDLNRRGTLLRRDYGLVELTFTRSSGWACQAVSLQVHRLATGGQAVVPPAIVAAYGPFPPTVSMTDLAAVLTDIGAGIEAGPDDGDRSFARYTVPGPGSEIHVVRDVPGWGATRPGAGDVWAISLGGG
jgi:hypothetical protein